MQNDPFVRPIFKGKRQNNISRTASSESKPIAYANSKGSDEPRHPRSFDRTFVGCLYKHCL